MVNQDQTHGYQGIRQRPAKDIRDPAHIRIYRMDEWPLSGIPVPSAIQARPEKPAGQTADKESFPV